MGVTKGYDMDLKKLDDVIFLDQRRKKFQALRFGFMLQLSYGAGWTDPLKSAALDVATQYWQSVPDKVDAFLRKNANRYSPIRDGKFIPYYQKLFAKTPDTFVDRHFIILADHTDGKPPAQHRLELTVGSENTPERKSEDLDLERSRLSCVWPVARCVDDPSSLIEMILNWCNLLHPEQGTAGIAPIAERGLIRNRFREYTPLLKRFPGLDMEYDPPIKTPLGGGLRTVNWLTIVGDSYIKALGGRDALQGMVSDQIKLHDYDGGVLIQAGELPELGDVNNGLWPEHYRDVNAILRPFRSEDIQNTPMCLIKVPEPMDAYEETLAWIRRFDRT